MTGLYQKAAAEARELAKDQPSVARLIRTLVSDLNRRDRTISEWRSGRAFKALERESESLRLANRYLRDMLREQAEKVSR